MQFVNSLVHRAAWLTDHLNDLFEAALAEAAASIISPLQRACTGALGVLDDIVVSLAAGLLLLYDSTLHTVATAATQWRFYVVLRFIIPLLYSILQ
jgi:hypothetical protein